MKSASGKYKYCWFLAFCAVTALVIVSCNLWLLCCGRCVLDDYLSVPPIGWALIAANLLAAGVLLAIKRRSSGRQLEISCGLCHADLRKKWSYCPRCGELLNP